MGSVYERKDSPFWWLKWRDESGTRKQKATPYRRDDPTGEARAREVLFTIEREVSLRRQGRLTHAITVSDFAKTWLAGLHDRKVKTADRYERRFEIHVLPALGSLPLGALTTLDLERFVADLRKTELAPRSQLHIARDLGQFVSAARRKGLTNADMGDVESAEMPENKDADPLWRKQAIFSRSEVEQIISANFAGQHRALWALLFLSGVRVGEALDLRWDRYDPRVKPLGRLLVATSYDTRAGTTGATKTGAVREVPVHSTLAAILAHWKVGGWARHVGRDPQPSDLIMPNAKGEHWSSTRTWDCFREDLARLGFRPRRQHDARRTFISLALGDGASREQLTWITHGRKGDVMSSYTTPQWTAQCEAVSRLQIGLLKGELVALPVAAGQLRPGYGPPNSSDSARVSVSGGGLEFRPRTHSGRLVTHASEGRQTQESGTVGQSPSERSQTATEDDDLISVRRARAHGFTVLPPKGGA